jgi:hypothetical protein
MVQPGAAAAAAAFDPIVPSIPPHVTAGLAAPGLRFVADAWRECEYSGVELELLRQAARALDDAELNPDVRARRLATRLFASLVAQLGSMAER